MKHSFILTFKSKNDLDKCYDALLDFLSKHIYWADATQIYINPRKCKLLIYLYEPYTHIILKMEMFAKMSKYNGLIEYTHNYL